MNRRKTKTQKAEHLRTVEQYQIYVIGIPYI